MTTDMHKVPSVAHNTGPSGDNATSVARYDLSTSEGGRRYVSDFFATELRRHDFTDYITTRLAADFACALAQHLAATATQQVGGVPGDVPVDVTDPWRGLYLPARMPAPSEYGDLTHPDIPLWPDEREDALDKLVHAQGFDFHIVAGDFTEAALEDADELYWQEMRAWNPGAPEGEWRLAWKGDTEDGPYAWFVRPMALRPEPAAPPAQGIDLAARPMDTAPRDGTLVRLLVDFDENSIEDSISATWTIGACNDDNVSEGARVGWQFAGWCWTHDHFTEGTGTPVGWLPLIDGQRDAAPGVGNG